MRLPLFLRAFVVACAFLLPALFGNVSIAFAQDSKHMTKAEVDQWLSPGKILTYARKNGQEVELTFRPDGSLKS